jgi:hypothetical protein
MSLTSTLAFKLGLTHSGVADMMKHGGAVELSRPEANINLQNWTADDRPALRFRCWQAS